MAENVPDVPDEEMKCNICLSDFTEPRLLDCFHVFCTPCLEHLIGENLKFICPLCRTEILVPNGVTGLAVYQTTKKVTIKFCDICQNRKLATVKCLTCDDNLCTSCHDHHSKVKALQDHRYEVLYEEGHVVNEKAKTGEMSSQKCLLHGKDLSLFCKPCNKALCSECFETHHNQHDVKTIRSVAAIEKDLLFSAIYGLKSKQHALERAIDIAKLEESICYKTADRVKQEITDHAMQLKKMFCKAVDIVMNTNLQQVDIERKKQIKQIENFIEETETDIISRDCFLRTTEDIINKCSPSELLEKSPNLRERFDKMINDDLRSVDIFDINYQTPEINEQTIKQFAGSVQAVNSKTVTPCVRKLPTPNLKIVKTMTNKSSIYMENVKSLVTGENDTIWTLNSYGQCTEWDTTKGTAKRSFSVDIKSNAKLIRTDEGRILIFSGTSAKGLGNSDKAENLFEVPFENGIACCLLGNGNLLVYNDTDKSLVEVQEKGEEVKRTIKNEALSSKLGPGIEVVCSKSSKLVFLVNNHDLITTNENGVIINTKYTGDNLRGICIDQYDNIFIGNTSKNAVELYNIEGIYKRNALSSSLNSGSIFLALDGYGNLCVLNSTYHQMYIYSYL